MHQKLNVLIFFKYILKNNSFEKHLSLTILLCSVVFTSFIFLFLFVFTLNFKKHNCNGGEEEDAYFALRIIHVSIYIYEACCGYSNNDFTRRIAKLCNFELGL
jgi:uncharacterized membrane protein YozB (DUF420 family)